MYAFAFGSGVYVGKMAMPSRRAVEEALAGSSTGPTDEPSAPTAVRTNDPSAAS